MTARHPDAGGLSVEEIAREEEICRDVLARYPGDRQITRILALCAMARQSIQMREVLEDVEDALIDSDPCEGSRFARLLGVVQDILGRAALATAKSGSNGDAA